MSNAFLAAMLTFSNEQLVAYHAIHSRSGVKEVRQAVSLSADIRKNRKAVEQPVGIIPVVIGQKVRVKAETSVMPELQTETLHEGPHPRSNVPWSIKNTRIRATAQAKAQAVQVSDSVPQDFADDSDDAVTDVDTPKLSPAQRVANGETISVYLPSPGAYAVPMFTGSITRITKSNCKLILLNEHGSNLTHRQEMRVLEYWASLVPAVNQARHRHLPYGNDPGYLRFLVRNLPAMLSRLVID